ncbi:unnamed protein product [Ilex paraguariensis]|uniref:HMA domain-containing protein n=1 Tax=Ilex paraguariensis TaxID=185542 RepID=A0ABC8UZ39_9AQUA
MAFVGGHKKGFTAIGLRNSGKTLQVQPRTTLASIESLTIPLVQEVVLLADFRCSGCQKRVAEIMSKMNGESDSVEVSVLEKKVTLTCKYPKALEVPSQQVAAIYRNPLNKFTMSMIMRLFRCSRTLLEIKAIPRTLPQK